METVTLSLGGVGGGHRGASFILLTHATRLRAMSQSITALIIVCDLFVKSRSNRRERRFVTGEKLPRHHGTSRWLPIPRSGIQFPCGTKGISVSLQFILSL